VVGTGAGIVAVFAWVLGGEIGNPKSSFRSVVAENDPVPIDLPCDRFLGAGFDANCIVTGDSIPVDVDDSKVPLAKSGAMGRILTGGLHLSISACITICANAGLCILSSTSNTSSSFINLHENLTTERLLVLLDPSTLANGVF